MKIRLEKKFFVVGFIIWLIIIVIRTFPTGPCFLYPDCMKHLLEEYGQYAVAGMIAGEIFIFLVFSYGSSWVWEQIPKRKSETRKES